MCELSTDSADGERARGADSARVLGPRIMRIKLLTAAITDFVAVLLDGLFLATRRVSFAAATVALARQRSTRNPARILPALRLMVIALYFVLSIMDLPSPACPKS
eukprot:7292484-Pyramimonas_sp.AAC.1